MRFARIGGLVIAGIVASTTVSCFLFDNRGDAEAIKARIAALPGVATADLDYGYDMTTGEKLRLTVTLDRTIAEDEAANVGRVYFEEVDRRHLRDVNGELWLRIPVAGVPSIHSTPSNSDALFKVGTGVPEVSAGQAADTTTAWMRAVHSPSVQVANVLQPEWSGGPQSRLFRVTLMPGTSAAEAQALQRSDPGLTGAHWELHVTPTPDATRAHDYVSTPNPPSDADMALWTQLSAVVGQYHDMKGFTGPMDEGRQAPTDVEIDILGTHPDTLAAVPRISRAAAALLLQFGHPAELLIRGSEEQIELVVGGCYRHRADHVVSPLEHGLATQYEKC